MTDLKENLLGFQTFWHKVSTVLAHREENVLHVNHYVQPPNKTGKTKYVLFKVVKRL